MTNDNAKTLTILITGSATATCIETGTVNDQGKRRNAGTTRSPIHAIARALLAEGHDPETLMRIVREREDGSHMPVFTKDAAIQVWAKLDCVENERHGPKVKAYVPMPETMMRRKDAA